MQAHDNAHDAQTEHHTSSTDRHDQIARLANELASLAAPIWHYGDGEGGAVVRVLVDAFESRGLNVGYHLRSAGGR